MTVASTYVAVQKFHPAAFSWHSRTSIRRREHPYVRGVSSPSAYAGAKRDLLSRSTLAEPYFAADEPLIQSVCPITHREQLRTHRGSGDSDISSALPLTRTGQSPGSATRTDLAICGSLSRSAATITVPAMGSPASPVDFWISPRRRREVPSKESCRITCRAPSSAMTRTAPRQTALMWEIAARPDLYQRGR